MVIELNGIRLYCCHGCLPEESVIGGNYIVNVRLEADLSTAGASDNLHDTIDYVHVNAIVEEEMAIRSKLIEHVCMRILNSLVAKFPALEKLEVQIVKVAPPINGNVDNVSVSSTWVKGR